MMLSKMLFFFFFFFFFFCFFILRIFTYRKRIRVKFTMNHVAQVLRLVDVGFTYLPLSSYASDTYFENRCNMFAFFFYM